ncbi:DUF1178 family protein [Lautropia dentalis]|uniref:DUF1178 family protein n=1 Tax=Lautropia dentalis TaxID=2490857 RepID=UPI0026BC7A42
MLQNLGDAFPERVGRLVADVLDILNAGMFSARLGAGCTGASRCMFPHLFPVPREGTLQEAILKVFDLCCEHEHAFEGWFASADDFEHQRETGLLECPMCGSRQVRKLLSAPRLNLSHAGETEGRRGSGAEAGAQGRAEGAEGERERGQKGQEMPSSGLSGGAEQMRELQGALMRGLRKLVESTEDVGSRFAEEARRIHFREAPARAIRGTATARETAELREEGIEVMTVPLPPSLKGPLQ